MDISITFPADDRIRVQSQSLFADPESLHCRTFVAKVRRAQGVISVAVRRPGSRFSDSTAEIRYARDTWSRHEVIESIRAQLVADELEENGRAATKSTRSLRSAPKERPGDDVVRPASGRKRKNPRPNDNGHANGVNGNAGVLSGHANGVNGHANGFAQVSGSRRQVEARAAKSMTVGGEPSESQGLADALPVFAKAIHGFLVRVRQLPLGKAKPQVGLPERFASGWELRHVSTGRLRFHHERLFRRREVCQAIERELMSVLGIDNYKTSSLTRDGPGRLRPQGAQRAPGHRDPRLGPGASRAPDGPDKARPAPAALHGLAAAGRGGPVRRAGAPAGGGGAVRLHVDPDVQGGREVLFEERRLGVDVLDAIVVVGCLGTMAIFPGAVLCWCLSFGRVLVKRTQDNSKKLLLERLRQAAAVCLALPRRRRGPGLARPAQAATSSSSTPARSCRSTGSSSRGWR